MPSTIRSASKLAAAFGAAVALVACGSRIPDTVYIGVAQPLSGPSAARGQDLLNGALFAAEEINAASYKIDGKTVRIEIVAKDDKANVDTAKQVAKELVDQKVSAVIGHLSSDVTEAVMPIYKAGNVPEFFTSSSSQLITPGEKGTNAFRMVANDTLQAKAIAGFATTTLKAKNVAIIFEDTATGKPMAKDVGAALAAQGRTASVNEAVDTNRTDFKAFVANVKASPPDVIVAIVRDNQLVPLFAELNAAGIDIPVIATSIAKTQKLLQLPVSPTALYVTSGSIDSSEFRDNDFLDKFRARFKSDPVWAAHYAYDVVYVVTDVMKRNKSTDPAMLRAKLTTTSGMAPATGTMRFDASGEQVYGAISVYQRRNGRWDPLMRSDRW